MKSLQKIVPLKKSRLHDEIASQLQKMIISGELAAGSKLPPERELAQAFDVNRGTVREALQKLEFLDLIEIRHGHGIYVKNYLDSGNLELIRVFLEQEGAQKYDIIKNLLEIRRILVPQMAYVVANERSEDDLKALEKVVRNEEGMSLMERDFAVHTIVATTAHNRVYLVLLNFFNGATLEIAERYFTGEATTKRTEKFHKDLFEAIKNRQPESARKIMYDALVNAERKIYQELEKIQAQEE